MQSNGVLKRCNEEREKIQSIVSAGMCATSVQCEKRVTDDKRGKACNRCQSREKKADGAYPASRAFVSEFRVVSLLS